MITKAKIEVKQMKTSEIESSRQTLVV